MRRRGSIVASQWRSKRSRQQGRSAAAMAWRSERTRRRSSVAVIKSTEGTGTPGTEQILREAGKRLRECRENDWIMRPKWRAGHGRHERDDGPFMTDVEFGKQLRRKNEPQMNSD